MHINGSSDKYDCTVSLLLNRHIKGTSVVLKTEQSLINYTDEQRSFENFPVSFGPNEEF